MRSFFYSCGEFNTPTLASGLLKLRCEAASGLLIVSIRVRPRGAAASDRLFFGGYRFRSVRSCFPLLSFRVRR